MRKIVLLLLMSVFVFNTFGVQIAPGAFYNNYYSNRIAKCGDDLLIATSKGIVKYNTINNSFYNASIELGADINAWIIMISVSPNGDLIYYTDIEEGAFVYDGEQAIIYDDWFSLGYSSSIIYSYTCTYDELGNIWFGAGGKVIPYNNYETVCDYPYTYRSSDNISSAVFSCISDLKFDSKGNLWITIYGDYNHFLYLKKEDRSTTLSLKRPKGNNGETKRISSLVIDKNDNIWYASENGINCYYQEEEQEVCMTKEQYPAMLENRYYDNDIDYNGNIWFTSEKNLLKWDGTEFTTYTCSDYKEARAMFCDGNIVWVLLKNDTLLKFESNEFETIDLSPAVTGIEESIAEVNKSKAFVTNEMLNIENAEGINSVVVYDTMGKVISSANANGATSTQITLPSTIKGMIMVKVNNEVIKVAI